MHVIFAYKNLPKSGLDLSRNLEMCNTVGSDQQWPVDASDRMPILRVNSNSEIAAVDI